MTQENTTTAPAKKRRRRRVLQGALGIVAIALILGVTQLPSLRNYYGKRGGLSVLEDVAYVPGSDHAKHKLDVYLPRKGQAGGPFPFVVFIHGGIWDAMDRRFLQPLTGLHGAVGVALANRSVGAAVVSYRQNPDAKSFDDSLDDVARATRFVLDHAREWGGDERRVVVVGHSAGGMLTCLLALDTERLARAGVEPGRIRGFGSLGGIYDLARILPALEPDQAATVRRLAGGDAGLARFSPQQKIRAGHPPMLLLVGQRDEPFLVSEHREMARALAETTPATTTIEVPQDDHMSLLLDLGTDQDEVLAPLVEFIQRVTGPGAE
jgi:acetyl esterase/lipase